MNKAPLDGQYYIGNPDGLVLSVIFDKCTAKRNSIKA